MSFVDVIANTHDRCSLARDDIEVFVRGVNAADVPGCQASVWLVAIVLPAHPTTSLPCRPLRVRLCSQLSPGG